MFIHKCASQGPAIILMLHRSKGFYTKGVTWLGPFHPYKGTTAAWSGGGF